MIPISDGTVTWQHAERAVSDISAVDSTAFI